MTGKTPPNPPFEPAAGPATRPPEAQDPAKDLAKDLALAPEPMARLPAGLERLAETAKAYARGAKAENTNRAYAAGWRHDAAWSRRGFPPLPPDPQVIGLDLAACASDARLGARGRAPPPSGPGGSPTKELVTGAAR